MSQKEVIQRLRENHEYIEHGELELRKARREQKELTAALLGLAKKEDKK